MGGAAMACLDAYNVKLTYFGITGLGEHIRVALALAGIPFEDERLTGEEWGKLKATLPPGSQMPILELSPKDGGDKQQLFQSRAILRLIGSAMYEGKPLYPTDPMERYHCDEVMEIIEDIRPHFLPTFAIQDQAEKEAARAALVAPGGKMYNGLVKLNERLGKFMFAAGEHPTIADAYVVTVCYMFQQPTFLDGFTADGLEV